MKSKLDIRDDINRYKEEYKYTCNKILLIKIAIYKGLYTALDGKKGIALSSKYDNIVFYSKIIFKYKLKLKNNGDNSKAINFLLKNMRENFKNPEFYIKDTIPFDNDGIARLLTELILSEYTEDIIINYNNIYDIAFEILQSIL